MNKDKNTTMIITHMEMWTEGMTVSQLSKFLELNTEVCETSFGKGAYGHINAVMANEMFKQVVRYLDELHIDFVTKENINKILSGDDELDDDTEIPTDDDCNIPPANYADYDDDDMDFLGD